MVYLRIIVLLFSLPFALHSDPLPRVPNLKPAQHLKKENTRWPVEKLRKNLEAFRSTEFEDREKATKELSDYFRSHPVPMDVVRPYLQDSDAEVVRRTKSLMGKFSPSAIYTSWDETLKNLNELPLESEASEQLRQLMDLLFHGRKSSNFDPEFLNYWATLDALAEEINKISQQWFDANARQAPILYEQRAVLEQELRDHLGNAKQNFERLFARLKLKVHSSTFEGIYRATFDFNGRHYLLEQQHDGLIHVQQTKRPYVIPSAGKLSHEILARLSKEESKALREMREAYVAVSEELKQLNSLEHPTEEDRARIPVLQKKWLGLVKSLRPKMAKIYKTALTSANFKVLSAEASDSRVKFVVAKDGIEYELKVLLENGTVIPDDISIRTWSLLKQESIDLRATMPNRKLPNGTEVPTALQDGQTAKSLNPNFVFYRYTPELWFEPGKNYYTAPDRRYGAMQFLGKVSGNFKAMSDLGWFEPSAETRKYLRVRRGNP